MLHHVKWMEKPAPGQFALSPVWKETQSPIGKSSAFVHKQKRLFVVASIDTLDEGNRWVHLSVSKQASQPTFMDLQMVKNHFMGQEATALQFFPAESEMVDMTDAYHLWLPLRGGAQQ